MEGDGVNKSCVCVCRRQLTSLSSYSPKPVVSENKQRWENGENASVPFLDLPFFSMRKNSIQCWENCLCCISLATAESLLPLDRFQLEVFLQGSLEPSLLAIVPLASSTVMEAD